MGWVARRSGRVPLPPAQAGGALCPRARGGSARTSDYAGSEPAELYNNLHFDQLPGGASCPREIVQNVGTDFVYIRRCLLHRACICAGTPQQAGGASCPRARRVGT